MTVGLQRHEIWVDLGLSGLTKWFGGPWNPGATTSGMIAEIADWGEGGFAPLLLEDALRVLNSPIPTRTADTVLCAALGRAYGPDFGGPGLLRHIVGACVERVRRDDPSYEPVPPGPSPYVGLAGEVLAEIDEAGPTLSLSVAGTPGRDVPGLVPALEQFVTEVDPDLGFRLFLRAMKMYAVPITAEQYTNYLALGKKFGYHEEVVDDGNLQIPDSLD
ncbi:hypothetical protein [Streptomyces sp. NPDC060198]|uniref:hypothetical protein n=1 Tax=Streptomyces sp. NPDC060198 TaxID=3347070 RepID=UPI003647AD2A